MKLFFNLFFERLKDALLFILIIIILIIMARIYGPWLELKYYPVITDFKITEDEVVDNYFNISFSYIKRRDCDLIGLSAYLSDDTDTDELAKTYIKNSVDEIQSTVSFTKPLDTLILSKPYSIILFNNPELNYLNKYVYLKFTYDCEPFWITEQYVGPIEIPNKN